MMKKLVDDLPEVYQPIYSHPELSDQVSRPCQDRLEWILGVHDALARLLERPLKVLDLGCAQGYFSCCLAEQGAEVLGIDYFDKNIAVCRALAEEHPQLALRFEVARLEEVIARLETGQYDLVLGLSVFHHIAHEKGIDTVKGLFERLAATCGALIVELALREEPLYWAAAQAQEPREQLDAIAFVHELARHPTHLSGISRPLYVASNQYWILDGEAERFHSWSTEPHALAHGVHQGSRRYYFSHSLVLKFYRFDHPGGTHNRPEFTKEIAFLEQPPAGFRVYDMRLSGSNSSEGWIVMQRLPGCLLLDLLREDVAFDRHAVLIAVLEQLAVLESAGLYHNDVRTWNVLVSEEGETHLIDYGAISPNMEDVVWPFNPLLAFFIFVREVATGVIDDPDPLRTIAISPFGLPQPYRAWASRLWYRPLAEWSFETMRAELAAISEETEDVPPVGAIEAWIRAVEEAIQRQKYFAQHIRHQANADKQHYHQALTMVADAHTREISQLGESLNQLGHMLMSKMSIAEAMEKQLVWTQERLLSSERKFALLESKAAGDMQRATTAEAQTANLQQQLEQQIEALARLQHELGLAHQERVHLQAHEHQLQEALQHAQRALVQSGDELRQAREQLRQSLANAHHWYLQANAHELQAKDVLNSMSWRVTRPLRLLMARVRSLRGGLVRLARRLLRPFLTVAMRWIMGRSELKQRLTNRLRRHPVLFQHLRLFALNRGFLGPLHAFPNPQPRHAGPVEDLSVLTPNTRLIYMKLKKAIQDKGAH